MRIREFKYLFKLIIIKTGHNHITQLRNTLLEVMYEQNLNFKKVYTSFDCNYCRGKLVN